MRYKAKIKDKEITISEHAALVLASLVELEDAGLIEKGDSTLLINDGYDEGSLETQSLPTVTYLGREFVKAMT